MKTEKQIPFKLKDPRAFQKYRKLKLAAKALQRKLDNLANKAGLPRAEDFKVKTKGYLIDNKNKPVGRFSTYELPKRVIPKCKICRVT